jgi:hypothetical protein
MTTKTTGPGWVITTDHIKDETEPEGSYLNAKGLMGPSTYEGDGNADDLPIPFRLYDDDGELYYTGRMNEQAMDAFGSGEDPLYGFGMGNAGATELRYKEGHTWRTL